MKTNENEPNERIFGDAPLGSFFRSFFVGLFAIFLAISFHCLSCNFHHLSVLSLIEQGATPVSVGLPCRPPSRCGPCWTNLWELPVTEVSVGLESPSRLWSSNRPFYFCCRRRCRRCKTPETSFLRPKSMQKLSSWLLPTCGVGFNGKYLHLCLLLILLMRCNLFVH